MHAWAIPIATPLHQREVYFFMNNLTTRKIVLGLLMTLVLAFSMQGNLADAQSVDVSGDGATTSSSSGTKIVEGPTPVTRSFEIAVSGASDGETIIIGDSGTSETVTITKITGADKLLGEDSTLPTLPGNAGASVTITVDAPGESVLDDAGTSNETFTLDFKSWDETSVNQDINNDGDETDTSVTAVYERDIGFDLNGDNDEADYLLSVSESAADKDFNADGDKTDTFNRDTTIYEEKADWRGSATLTVEYSVSSYGEYMVVVGGNVDSIVDGSPIMGYVVRSTSQAKSQRTSFTATPSSILVNARADDIALTVTTTRYSRIKFDIESGDGSLYTTSGTYYVDGSKVKMNAKNFGDSPFSVYNTDSTGTVTVYYQPDSDTTARIKMEVENSAGIASKHYVTVFYNSAVTVMRISGNNQFGQANTSATPDASRAQLANPLVVQVLDGTRPVANQVVKFSVGAGRTALLRYHSTTTYVQTTIANTGQNENTIYVKTDSRGGAKVYLVPSTSAGTETVTYTPVSLTADLDAESNTQPTVSPAATANRQFTATATPAISTSADEEVDRDATDTTQTPQVNAQYGTVNTPLTMSVALTGDPSNVQVRFEITGGRIYLSPIVHDQSNPDYKTSLTTVTNSDGAASVFVQVNNGATARVTARIAGNNTHTGRHTVTYFWKYPHIEYVSGNNRRGATGGRLEDPLVVRVLDGQGGRPVPGQVVKFEETSTADPADTDVMRSPIPVPGETVYVMSASPTILANDSSGRPDSLRTRIATSAVPAVANSATEDVFVETGSDGQASVYLRLGRRLTTNDPPDETSVDHQVTASTPEGSSGGFSDNVQFSAKAISGAREANLMIVSGDGQRADKHSPLPKPLVVRVRTVRGFLISGVRIQFTALDGTLVTTPGTEMAEDSPAEGGNEIEVLTNADGIASVEYNIGAFVVGRQVTAEVVGERGENQYDFEIDEVKFGVNGGRGTGGGTTTPPRTPTNRIGISPSTITDEPGEEVTISITSDPSGRFVTLSSNDFANANFSPQSGITPFTSTLLLPDEEDDYTFSATSAGLTPGSARVTVEEEEAEEGTFAISGETGGTPGSQITVTVTATDAGGVRDVGLDFTISGTSILTATGRTTVNGIGRAIVGLPSPVGTYPLVARATGYTDRPFNVTVSPTGQTTTPTTPTPPTPTTPTTPTTGVPDSISIVGPSQRSGTVNEELEAALIVRVLDDDDNGIEDARVYLPCYLKDGVGFRMRPEAHVRIGVHHR